MLERYRLHQSTQSGIIILQGQSGALHETDGTMLQLHESWKGKICNNGTAMGKERGES